MEEFSVSAFQWRYDIFIFLSFFQLTQKLTSVSSHARIETISRDVRDLDKARESQYFAHEDYEALKRLAKKARTSADEKDPTEAKRRSEHEKQELRKAVGPHLSDGDLSKILAWFHKSGTGTRA